MYKCCFERAAYPKKKQNVVEDCCIVYTCTILDVIYNQDGSIGKTLKMLSSEFKSPLSLAPLSPSQAWMGYVLCGM